MSIEITAEFAAALETLNSGQSMFLTGKAGTGKSTLIRHFMEGTDRRVVVAAPTGVAALNVNGYTLHRLFGYSTTTTLDDIRKGHAKPRKFAKVIKSLDTLIIDEVSMVRADVFDMVIESLRAYGPKRNHPTGGVQIVLVGDLYQLPPVVGDGEEEYFTTEYSTPYFFSAHTYDDVAPAVCQLTHVFRQKGDLVFTRTLNAIRDGRIDATTLNTLNGRVDKHFEPSGDNVWITLTTTNKRVQSINKKELEKLPGALYTATAHTTGDIQGYEPIADYTLTFKVGAQVMLLSNDPNGEWVNGSIGVIIDVESNDDADDEVVIELRDGSVIYVGPHVWEITRPQVNSGKLEHEVIGTFTQYPFKLAWGITIHKSQGQTLDRAIVDLAGGTFATGQLYVALSRCTSLDGLVLRHTIKPRDLKVDYLVRNYLDHNSSARATRHVALSLLNVGQTDGFVRPIEIALAFPDGSTLTSIVDPLRDIGTSAADYGIPAGHLQVAPTLVDLWPELERRIDGMGIVAHNAEYITKILDVELKRNGMVTQLPILDASAVNYHPSSSTKSEGEQSALSEAIAIANHIRTYLETPGNPPLDVEPYRTSATVAAGHYTPVVYGIDIEPEATTSWILTRDLRIETNFTSVTRVATLLTAKLANQHILDTTRTTIENFCRDYDVTVELPGTNSQQPLVEVLKPGLRIAFTGTCEYDGVRWERHSLAELAEQHGYHPQGSVSKTKCDILVAADVTTRSGKANKAREFGKPIYPLEEFLAAVGVIR